jgi:carbonic anhydrase/acetyltransferase-like protein (isoleucine patch superfamily)
MEYAFDGSEPAVHPEAFVCDEATLVGDVTVGPDSSVWPGAVLRGDLDPVRVGECSHVEDTCVLHQSTVGDRVMVGHAAVVNTATVGSNVLVGMNATINNGARIGDRCVVAPNTVVPQDRDVPDGSLVMGVPATVRPFDETEIDGEAILAKYSPDHYVELANRHTDLFDLD